MHLVNHIVREKMTPINTTTEYNAIPQRKVFTDFRTIGTVAKEKEVKLNLVR